MWWFALLGCTGSSPPDWLEVESRPDLVHRLLFRAHAGGALTVACEHAGDASEVHAVTGPSPVHLDGLLADTRYICTATAGGRPESWSVTTPPLPALPGEWALAESAAGEGYTLFNIGRTGEDKDAQLVIVDREGRVRWTMSVDQGLEPPDVDSAYLGDGVFLYGGGQVLVPEMVDLGGNISWTGPESSTGSGYHHITELAPDGNVLTMIHSPMFGPDGDSWNGFEVQWIDPATNAIARRLHAQTGVDNGWLEIPPADVGDAYHANSVTDLGDGTILLSLLYGMQVLRVEVATGIPVWQAGPFIGDLAALDADGEPDPAAWFYTQHAPELRGDELLLYDNGDNPDGVQQTRVVAYRLDEAARTLQLQWEWTEPGWFEPVWGDVDWLPNGNVLVTRAHHGWGTAGHVTELVELDAATHLPVWRLRMLDAWTTSFRAERLDGCAIFANAKYCPSPARAVPVLHSSYTE